MLQPCRWSVAALAASYAELQSFDARSDLFSALGRLVFFSAHPNPKKYCLPLYRCVWYSETDPAKSLLQRTTVARHFGLAWVSAAFSLQESRKKKEAYPRVEHSAHPRTVTSLCPRGLAHVFSAVASSTQISFQQPQLRAQPGPV